MRLVALALLAAAPVALAAAFSNVPAAWALTAAVALVALAEALAAPDADSAGSRTDALTSAASALVLLAVWMVAAATPQTGVGWSVGAGVGLIAAGSALRVAALRALGDRFCSHVRAAPSADLATSGVYSRIRHPSELGLLLLGLGGVVATWSGPALALWMGASLPLTWLRCIREDRLLGQAFGARHAAYCRRVRRFGP